MIHIRLGNSFDAPTLARLRYLLRSRNNEDIEQEAEFLTRCATWMSIRLQQDNWRCWVAEKDDTIVGSLWLQLIEKIPNPTAETESYAYITNVFVLEPERVNGIGSQLLSAAIEYCKQQSVHSVILWPTEKSRTLYERHGFAVTPDLFELVLCGQP